jgi:hypothetical protein
MNNPRQKLESPTAGPCYNSQYIDQKEDSTGPGRTKGWGTRGLDPARHREDQAERVDRRGGSGDLRAGRADHRLRETDIYDPKHVDMLIARCAMPSE